MDANEGRGGHGGDKPAKSAKIVWWIGMALLAVLIVIAVRSFVSGGEKEVQAGDKGEVAH